MLNRIIENKYYKNPRVFQLETVINVLCSSFVVSMEYLFYMSMTFMHNYKTLSERVSIFDFRISSQKSILALKGLNDNCCNIQKNILLIFAT